MISIGIDPGVTTGLAVAYRGDITHVRSDIAVVAEVFVLDLQSLSGPITVYIEDARKRQWFGNADSRQLRSGAGIREGVGSVKRDCQRWQEFCEYHGIDYVLVAPQANRTKLTAEQFRKLTGWTGRTNEHSRDAAMLVWCMG